MVPLLCLIRWSRGSDLTQAAPNRVPSWMVGIQIQRVLEWNKHKCSWRYLCIFIGTGKGRKPVCGVKNKAHKQPGAERKERPHSALASGSSLFLRPGCTLTKSYGEPNLHTHEQWPWRMTVVSMKHHDILKISNPFLLMRILVSICFKQALTYQSLC